MGGRLAAISCSTSRGSFFSRFANSKQTGEAASPISIFGGRSNTIGNSTLYLDRMCFASASRSLVVISRYTKPPSVQPRSGHHSIETCPCAVKARQRHATVRWTADGQYSPLFWPIPAVSSIYQTLIFLTRTHISATRALGEFAPARAPACRSFPGFRDVCQLSV